MLDLEDIGYFLFMQQQEEEQIKFNDESENDLVREQPTTNTEKEKN